MSRARGLVPHWPKLNHKRLRLPGLSPPARRTGSIGSVKVEVRRICSLAFEREQGQSDCLALLGGYVQLRRRRRWARDAATFVIGRSLLGTARDYVGRHFMVVSP
jgi:hypothetical protein